MKAARSISIPPQTLDIFAGLRCHKPDVHGGDTVLADKHLSPGEIESLYERHGGALAAYACTFVNDFAAAEDVVHQVFLKLLGNQTMTPDQPIAYLYRAVRNTALNAQRIAKREIILDHAGEDPAFQRRDGDRAAALALQAALAELPD